MEHSTSIRDAQIFAQTLSYAIDNAFMKRRGEVKVSDLKLEDSMQNNAEAKRYKALLAAIEGETVFVAIDLLGTLKSIVDRNLETELKGRKLSDLPIKFVNDQ